MTMKKLKIKKIVDNIILCFQFVLLILCSVVTILNEFCPTPVGKIKLCRDASLVWIVPATSLILNSTDIVHLYLCCCNILSVGCKLCQEIP